MIRLLKENLSPCSAPSLALRASQYAVLGLYLGAFASQAESSFSPYASFTVDSSQVLSGGLKRDFTSRLLFDGGAEYQVDQHLVFLSYQFQRGPVGSDSVGDIQAYSNIDEDNFSRIYEFFYQYQGDDWFARIGKTDANAEFAVADPAGNFINSSMGFSPTIVAFPTYPIPALSILGGYTLTSQLELAAGVFASHDYDNFSEQFYISELRFHLSEQSQIKLGFWHDTNRYESLDSDAFSQNGTTGYYLIVQSELENIRWFDSQQVNWYWQLGKSDVAISEIEWHMGSGFEIDHPFGLNEHGLGFGLSYVKLSPNLNTEKSHETAIEAYYLWPLSELINVKPDLQYIINPSGSEQIDDALVFTLRLELNF